jgi:WD40 repeat protein
VTLHNGCFVESARAVLPNRAGKLFAMCLSRDGSTLATGDFEGVRLWDIATGQQLGELGIGRSHVTCLEFTPDGRMLAVGGWNGEIHLFDLSSRRQHSTIRAHEGPVNILAFADDGGTLAS